MSSPDFAARGRQFWDHTTTAYDLSDPEMTLLTEVCRTLDVLDALDESVRRDGTMTLGSSGQTVVNPAVTEARGQRITLHRLLSALALPDADGHHPNRPAGIGEGNRVSPVDITLRTRAAAGELMAKAKAPRATAAGDVPPELLDLGHEVWRDPAEFTGWCRQHGIQADAAACSWAQRFQRARDGWAAAAGIVNSRGHVDHRRLQAAGVPWCGSRTRAMAAAEAGADDPVGYRRSCRLAPYGDQPDRYPTWLPSS